MPVLTVQKRKGYTNKVIDRRQFVGHKTIGQVIDLAAAQGLDWRPGLATIGVFGGGGHAVYNEYSGRFYGRTDKHVAFDSHSRSNDRHAWMHALMHFFWRTK